MADNVNENVPASSGVETTDRGLFDFMKKEKKEEDKSTLESEFDHKVQVSEAEYKKEEGEDDKKHGVFADKLHRSDSSSSSSSEDEADDEEKKKKKKEKKGLKEKLKEKLPGHKNEEDTNVPIEKYEEEKPHPHPHVQEVVYSEPSSHPEEKGFLDKIKDKLPGQKKVDEHHHETVTAPPPVVEGEKDKKGFMDKIKEKIPGFSSKTGEDKKEHDDK